VPGDQEALFIIWAKLRLKPTRVLPLWLGFQRGKRQVGKFASGQVANLESVSKIVSPTTGQDGMGEYGSLWAPLLHGVLAVLVVFKTTST
jgi:hypothetical protein